MGGGGEGNRGIRVCFLGLGKDMAVISVRTKTGLYYQIYPTLLQLDHETRLNPLWCVDEAPFSEDVRLSHVL